jgi:hypothetical protein
MSHFASEAFESITHADSRLWRTLVYLLTRPGRLTKEFFEGKRARYLPPFRLYLVISVVFFLVGLPEDVNLKLTGEAVSAETARQVRADVAAQSATLPKPAQEIAAQAAEKATSSQVNVSLSGLDDFCKAFTKQQDPGNEYAARLRDRCRRLAGGDGRTVWNNGIHQVPRAMFIFLPVLALVMKLLATEALLRGAPAVPGAQPRLRVPDAHAHDPARRTPLVRRVVRLGLDGVPALHDVVPLPRDAQRVRPGPRAHAREVRGPRFHLHRRRFRDAIADAAVQRLLPLNRSRGNFP